VILLTYISYVTSYTVKMV